MNNRDSRFLETKILISEQAVEQYIRQNGSFTLKSIARELDMTVGEIFNYFPDKRSILQFHYASLVFRYRAMVDEITDFESYMLGEKLSNFAYTSFDMLEERKPFVDATFQKLIVCSPEKTEYEKEIEKLLEEFIANDALVSTTSDAFSNRYLYSFFRCQYFGLIRFWLNDRSEGHVLTMELTDKLTGFVQEVMYSAILDRGLDIVKFVVSNYKSFLQNIPFARDIFSKIEIR